MMMEQQFCKAAESFRAGRLVECRDRLLEVQLQGFSRVQWYLDCNLLTCRFKDLLQRGGKGTELQEILLSYQQLWQRITGLVPNPCSLSVELAVVLALCQLHTILSHWSSLTPLISTAIDRIGQVSPPSSLTASLDSLDVSSFGAEAVKCVEKLKVFSALGETESQEKENSISKVVDAHSQWLSGDQSEACYRKAWNQFNNGDPQLCLQTLSSPPLSPPPPTLSPLLHLLCGACHSRLAHPNLALLHWKRCMEIGHILNHTPFLASLQNSGLCYTEMGNTVAAVATRRLEIEALKCRSAYDSFSLPVWVWLHDGVGVAGTAHRPLAVARFCLAWQLARGQRYEEASQMVEECLADVEHGAIVCYGASSLPPPSALHLLRVLCEVAGKGDGVSRGKQGCLKLLQTSPDNHLWRSKVMCILATASFNLGEYVECRQWGLRCLGEVEKMVCEVRDQQLLQLKCHCQLLLALLAIGHTHWREALQLLACVLATPTGLYNHCLLQCRVGVVMGGANGWLERRGKTPAGKSEARERLTETLQQLKKLSGCDRDYVAMDAAMLKIWLQHNK